MPVSRVLAAFFTLVLLPGGASLWGQNATSSSVAEVQPPPPDPTQDVLYFKDGDRITGELVRIERGHAIFRSNKSGELTVSFDHILDLRCARPFAVLRKGLRVNARNALIGRIELRGSDLILTPAQGSAVSIPAAEVAFAIEDKSFQTDVARHLPLHEGWAETISVGASIVRATEKGTAFNTEFALSRTVPRVTYLPRRRRTELIVRDSYDLVDQPAVEGQPPQSSETHIFHAQVEDNEYLHSRFYFLADYSFDRNYSQGLLAQELAGGGLGATLIKTPDHTLDIKSDVHRSTQGFVDPSANTTLIGQKIVIDYEGRLPGSISLRNTSDYLPSYNRPHDYSANTTFVVTVPLYRSLGISFTTTDNYLNNTSRGLKRNTFRFATSLTFSH